MKIEAVRSYKRSLALKKPYTIARQTIAHSENVFFELELENGIVGYGAACPEEAVVGETADVTWANLQSELVARLIGKDIRHFLGEIASMQPAFEHFPGTMAAIDIAMHDAFGKFLGIPIVDFYGRHHRKMLTSITIGIKGVGETLEEAKEYERMGFRAFKVKTGINVEEDVARILSLREHYKDGFSIRVDANTGYSPLQLTKFLNATKHARVEVIEQPFLPGSENELLQYDKESRATFAADESLTNTASALALTKNHPFGIFNIKLMKCGGIRAALEIASIAQHAGINLFWGCNDESRISISAALHAAFSCRHTKFLDLDGSFDLAEDLVEGGFIVEEGYLFPNGQAGLGLTGL